MKLDSNQGGAFALAQLQYNYSLVLVLVGLTLAQRHLYDQLSRKSHPGSAASPQDLFQFAGTAESD
jgi:hypothetical protein